MKQKIKAFCMIVGAVLIFAKCLDIGYTALDWAQGAFYDSRAYLCSTQVEAARLSGFKTPQWVKNSAKSMGVSEEEILASMYGEQGSSSTHKKNKKS